MISKFEDVQQCVNSQIEALTAASNVVAKGLQQIADETSAYSKKQFEISSLAFREMLDVKSFGKAIEIQTGFARQAYAGLVAQSTKVGEIYSELVKDVVKPVQQVSKQSVATATVQPIASKPKAVAS